MATIRTRVESLVDYSQSQILTSTEHVESLHNIALRKEQLTQEREIEKVERELIKYARTIEIDIEN